MTFTKTPPTTPGFYAHKQHDLGIIELRKFDEHDLRLLPENAHRLWGEWCRLVPAEELKLAYKEGWMLYDFGDPEEGWNNSRAKQVAEVTL